LSGFNVMNGSTPVRLAFVGGEHVHFAGVLASALASPTTEVVGFSISDGELRRQFAHSHPDIPAFAEAGELYDKTSPQAIVTCADNRRAAQVVADAADRGLHIMKEKPLAADFAEARAMAEITGRRGVRLMVNWKTSWHPAMHTAKRLVEEGEIGRPLGIYHRDGHGGPPASYASDGPVARVGWAWLIDREANGGGAAVDFCCYGAAISRWFMGQPAHVQAYGGNYAKDFFSVEDNGIMVLGYPRGHSVAEGTWSQPGIPVRLPTMIYGEKGAIAVVSRTEVRLALGVPGQLAASDAEVVAAGPLPPHFRSGPDYFTYSLLHDEPFVGLPSLEVSLDAQEILEAGLRSMSSGQRVDLPLSGDNGQGTSEGAS
jgi:predicted dehydrogenase